MGLIFFLHEDKYGQKHKGTNMAMGIKISVVPIENGYLIRQSTNGTPRDNSGVYADLEYLNYAPLFEDACSHAKRFIDERLAEDRKQLTELTKKGCGCGSH